LETLAADGQFESEEREREREREREPMRKKIN
jgi:hypothetical protein